VLLAGQLHKVAKSLQEVQDGLDIAFSPSLGSARRVGKSKQIFVDDMPAGSEFKACPIINTQGVGTGVMSLTCIVSTNLSVTH